MSEITTIVDTEDNTTITVEEIVQSLTDQETYSAYGIHVLVNKTFQVVEFDKTIPPQMMYNYSRNGMISKRAEKPNKDHSYTRDQVVAFVTKYVNKQLAK